MPTIIKEYLNDFIQQHPEVQQGINAGKLFNFLNRPNKNKPITNTKIISKWLEMVKLSLIDEQTIIFLLRFIVVEELTKLPNSLSISQVVLLPSRPANPNFTILRLSQQGENPTKLKTAFQEWFWNPSKQFWNYIATTSDTDNFQAMLFGFIADKISKAMVSALDKIPFIKKTETIIALNSYTSALMLEEIINGVIIELFENLKVIEGIKEIPPLTISKDDNHPSKILYDEKELAIQSSIAEIFNSKRIINKIKENFILKMQREWKFIFSKKIRFI